MQRLLSESSAPQFTKLILLERKSVGKVAGDGHLRVRGVLQAVDKVNENNRRYGPSIWDTNLAKESPFMQRLERKRVLGCVEHPLDGNTMLPQVSHLVERVWRERLDEGNEYGVGPNEYVLGEIMVLKTPNGLILEALYKAGVDVGFSSRGRGDTRNIDGIEEVTEYALDTWDAVYSPSVEEARPRPVGESMSGTPFDKPMTVADAISLRRKTEHAVTEVEDPAQLAEIISESSVVLERIKKVNESWSVSLASQVSKNLFVLNEKMKAIIDSDKVLMESSEKINEEADWEKVAADVEKNRKEKGKVVYRDELDSIITNAGQEINDNSVRKSADALKRKGLAVDDKKTDPAKKTEATVEPKKEEAAPAAKPEVKPEEKSLVSKLTGVVAEQNSQLSARDTEILNLRKELSMREREQNPGSARESLLEKIKRRKAARQGKGIGQAHSMGKCVGESEGPSLRERILARRRLRERLAAREPGDRRVGGVAAGGVREKIETASRSVEACAEALRRERVARRVAESKIERLGAMLLLERKNRRIAEARLSAAKQLIRERLEGKKPEIKSAPVVESKDAKPAAAKAAEAKPVEKKEAPVARGRSSLPAISEDSLKRAGQTAEPKAEAAGSDYMAMILKRASEV